ncbi:hypothetical protein VFPFJ_10670 [Purpureocillium lilacinum]|uniref:Uncharacterized protein n=1 Tax=Purpureocillium lilacinum TaxID=33203 RepID=A0A179GDK2_PURLI|nr:hypothetical protein VFPFJ_10670 [Purpureocillium lilacinum]OAQ75906.1 hypothetical protein VFPFJ_10670 [Purpureocillium lilacinum]
MHSAFGVCVASQHRSTARPRFPAECPPAATELTLSDGHWWPRHGCKLYFASAQGSAGHGVSGVPPAGLPLELPWSCTALLYSVVKGQERPRGNM